MAETEWRIFHWWSPIEQMDSIKIRVAHESCKHISGIPGIPSIPHTPEVQSDSQFDLVDFSAGFVAGCTGVVMGHPFDTVKVRQQTLGANYSTMRKCVRQTVANEGMKGFYKGLLFPLAAQGCLNCLFFGVYERIKGDGSASYGKMALAGAIGGAAQSSLATPIELVKIKMQNQTATEGRLYKGPVNCVSSIMRTHGPRRLLHGLSATTIRDSIGFSLYMTSYEYMCRLCHPEGPDKCSIGQLLLTGGCAGAFSWALNFPVDTVKSRIQGDNLASPKYRGFLDCFYKVTTEEGPRALFKGLPAVLLRSFALNAVTLTVYSCSRQYLTNLLKQPLYEQ